MCERPTLPLKLPQFPIVSSVVFTCAGSFSSWQRGFDPQNHYRITSITCPRLPASGFFKLPITWVNSCNQLLVFAFSLKFKGYYSYIREGLPVRHVTLVLGFLVLPGHGT